jgi:hypothetical protein
VNIPQGWVCVSLGRGGRGVVGVWAWRNLENNALSSLHELLRKWLVWEGMQQYPPYTHSLAGFVTINVKTTVHCASGSSMGASMSDRGGTSVISRICAHRLIKLPTEAIHVKKIYKRSRKKTFKVVHFCSKEILRI